VDQVGASAFDPKGFLPFDVAGGPPLEDARVPALGKTDFLALEEADEVQVAPRTEESPQAVPHLGG